jgi:hypothetical protein
LPRAETFTAVLKSDAMMDVYDLNVPRTTTPGGV